MCATRSHGRLDTSRRSSADSDECLFVGTFLDLEGDRDHVVLGPCSTKFETGFSILTSVILSDQALLHDLPYVRVSVPDHGHPVIWLVTSSRITFGVSLVLMDKSNPRPCGCPLSLRKTPRSCSRSK